MLKNKNVPLFRPALALFGFASIFFLSPVFVFLVIIVLSVRYRAWEALFMGLIMDFMWAPGGSMMMLVPFSTLLAIFIVWALEPLRSELLTA
jgi:hypothetical protein